MADYSVALMEATWAGRKAAWSVEQWVAALMDASWVDRKDGLTAVCLAAHWAVLWVAQMDER